MTPVPPQPIEELALAVARLDPQVATRVVTQLPATLTYPIVRLTLLPGGHQAGGDHEDHFLRRERIQVEAFGNPDPSVDGKAEAWDAIVDVHAKLLDAAGTYDRGAISGAEEESTPYWLPDPEDNGPRYLSTVALYCHPAG